ncbi:MAG: S4 domain-containing protein [Acidimicrobiales bacterium]
MAVRRRLDAEMLRRGLVPSREQAARLINEGKVLVDGAIADKPARQVLPGQDVKLSGRRPSS